MYESIGLKLQSQTQELDWKPTPIIHRVLKTIALTGFWRYPMTSLTELLKDMRKLETDLSRFETRFSVKSQGFYASTMHGDLEESDAWMNTACTSSSG